MADILIRGMKIPRFCCECPLKEQVFFYDHNCIPQKKIIKVNFDTGKDEGCPLVPLQEGHGRLGDLDEMMEYIKNHEYELKSRMGCVGNGMFTYQIKEYANNHTIVPAEGGDADGNP